MYLYYINMNDVIIRYFVKFKTQFYRFVFVKSVMFTLKIEKFVRHHRQTVYVWLSQCHITNVIPSIYAIVSSSTTQSIKYNVSARSRHIIFYHWNILSFFESTGWMRTKLYPFLEASVNHSMNETNLKLFWMTKCRKKNTVLFDLLLIQQNCSKYWILKMCHSMSIEYYF